MYVITYVNKVIKPSIFQVFPSFSVDSFETLQFNYVHNWKKFKIRIANFCKSEASPPNKFTIHLIKTKKQEITNNIIICILELINS